MWLISTHFILLSDGSIFLSFELLDFYFCKFNCLDHGFYYNFFLCGAGSVYTGVDFCKRLCGVSIIRRFSYDLSFLEARDMFHCLFSILIYLHFLFPCILYRKLSPFIPLYD